MITTLFALIVGHALADYPLQTDFLARGKNRHNCGDVPPGAKRQTIWPYCLSAHALIHGGAVVLITGSAALGIVETLLHWAIDFGKCENWYGIHADQGAHVACKLLWAVIA